MNIIAGCSTKEKLRKVKYAFVAAAARYRNKKEPLYLNIAEMFPVKVYCKYA